MSCLSLPLTWPPLPPFCFSVPILVGCFPLQPSTRSPSWVTRRKHFRLNSTNWGRGLTAHTSTNTRTHARVATVNFVGKISNGVGDDIWKKFSPTTLIKGFLPIKFNFYYYFCKKSQGYTYILVQPLFCSVLVLWALLLNLEWCSQECLKQ